MLALTILCAIFKLINDLGILVRVAGWMWIGNMRREGGGGSECGSGCGRGSGSGSGLKWVEVIVNVDCSDSRYDRACGLKCKK